MEHPKADVIQMKKPEEPKAPKLVNQIVINRYSDGNINVEGPMHDRVLYHGLLFLAGEIGKEWAQKQERDQQRLEEERRKEPFWKRVIREKREKKEAEKLAKEQASKQQPPVAQSGGGEGKVDNAASGTGTASPQQQ